jgi:hypothetical protein
MSHVQSSTPHHTHVSLIRRSLPWIGVSLLATPLGILLHELGHYSVAFVFDFPDLVLHYANVSDNADGAGFPLWQRGLQAAAGPLVTVLIVLVSCVLTVRLGARASTIVPAFAAGWRSIALGFAYLIALLLYPDAKDNFDEAIAGRSLGVPPLAIVAVSVLPIPAAWVFLLRQVPASERMVALGSTALGTVMALVIYAAWIGPAFLP